MRCSLFALALALVAAAPARGFAQEDPLDARTKGAATAPITVYEMSDFQCPYCKRHFDQTFPSLEKEYVTTGKVRWIFINLPIPGLHANAIAAAEFSLCAARLGKFWPAHDLLYGRQDAWAKLDNPTSYFLGLSDQLKLPRARMSACLALPEIRAEVKSDSDGAAAAGASSTPTFYIGAKQADGKSWKGLLLTGAQPLGLWRQVLDSMYRAKRG